MKLRELRALARELQYGRPAREVDRHGWSGGPWDDEPDREEWTYDGLTLSIIRSGNGSLLGYVHLPLDHPLAVLGAGDKPISDIAVEFRESSAQRTISLVGTAGGRVALSTGERTFVFGFAAGGSMPDTHGDPDKYIDMMRMTELVETLADIVRTAKPPRAARFRGGRR
jgi:hypothetical protein